MDTLSVIVNYLNIHYVSTSRIKKNQKEKKGCQDTGLTLKTCEPNNGF